MIYADFESIPVPENNGKQNPDESYLDKYQNILLAVIAINWYVLMFKFSKPFTSYLGKNAVCRFINSMIEESKYCSGVIKMHFKKELAMTKEDNEDFENSTECWICDNDYVNNDVKVRDHCRITGEALRIEIVISMLN